jgi:hypothetical protein
MDVTAEGSVPRPGSTAEADAFAALQAKLRPMYQSVFADPRAPRTVIVDPSMSLARSELAKIPGVIHYEERLLCLLMLLKLPRTQVIYLTSIPLDPAIVDYYLHLLPGIPGMHARKRLTLISANDDSLIPLSKKIVDNPDLLREIKSAIRYPNAAHLSCFNATEYERTLAVQLGTPMYACDPDLAHLGNKTMSRQIFREVGLDVPDGFEELRDTDDLVSALIAIHQRNPTRSSAVIKLNEGFSGEGNALVSLSGLSEATDVRAEVRRRLRDELHYEAEDESWEEYESKMLEMGGIAESFIGGKKKRSPSVQMRIDPLDHVQLVSTHDQVLGGPSGQVYEGCTFPAQAAYRMDLHDAGLRVGDALKRKGVLGRFGIDFVSVYENQAWKHYAIEINLRKGGTTLPYLMLEFLTDGEYHPTLGRFFTLTGDVRTYYATDTLMKESYRGLEAEEMIDIAVLNGLHYRASAQEGVVFHLLGAVSGFGKIGMVSVAEKRKLAYRRYESAVTALNRATADR